MARSRIAETLESHTQPRRRPLDWTAIGALGEIVGASAVVLTLAYLARQVRQANRIAKAEAYRAARAGFNAITESWANDQQWRELYARILGGARREELSTDDRLHAAIRYSTMLNSVAAIHYDVELGVLPSSAYDIVGTANFNTPYFSDTWPLLKQEQSDSFVTFFESRFYPVLPDSWERIPARTEGANPSST